MRPLLLTVLAAYVVAAIHSILAFSNKRQGLERIALSAIAVGFALHTVSLAGDWIQDGHYPLFGMRETLSFLAWTLAAAYGYTLIRYKTWSFGVFVTPIVAALTLVANITPDRSQNVASFVNIHYGRWLLPLHTTLISFAYAAFFVGFVASIMYLLLERELRLKTFGAVFHRLPSLSTVNDIATATVSVGLSLLTIGMVTGMIWSASRDGRFWHNDPKEVLAFLTWVLYLGLMLYRTSANWRGRFAAWLGVAGFVLVLMTFLGARLMGGYHTFG
jgi:cytochrome c-type biogenesis protein CcsB